MEVHEARSSSNDLSSAPPSDSEHTPGPRYIPSHPNPRATGSNGVVHDLNSRLSHTSPSAAVSATSAGPRQADGAPLPAKKTRKKREPKDPNAPPKEKKPSKPRVPRASAASATGTSRKRTKVEPPADEGSTIYIPSHQNPSLQSSTLVQPVFFTQHSTAAPRQDEVAKHTESGFSMHDRPNHSDTSPPPRVYDYNPPALPPPPSQSSNSRPSSAMYDPIRGSVMHRPIDPTPPMQQTPPRPTYNASTSPAISGIIHPQPEYSPSTTIVTHHPKPDYSNQVNGRNNTEPPKMNDSNAMDIDIADQAPPKKPGPPRKAHSEASTRATSPKPTRAKEQPPPPPMGSGLLSASLFGGDTSSEMNSKDPEKGPNIILHVDLKDENNRVINFARMAEEKYGFAALYPRLAAQKERLAKVAAAGAALERGKPGGTPVGDSGDEDLSVDIDRDSGDDRDVEMSGINGGQDQINSGTDGPGPKKKRRRKVEEYDQEDDFIDDSEMLWEAQAAASKDGFFVYCGPLVPEGEKPAVERADGTVKRGRGRGRGGGPGSRGGRSGAATSANTEGGTTRRGGGPGSRGGTTTRKPRITKNDREQMTQEKLDREKMATLVSKPAAYPG